MNDEFVIGYDPGGNGKHGIAALHVERRGGKWVPLYLEVTTADVLQDAVEWALNTCRTGRIVAAGADTLTEWNANASGWRPADLWLRDQYKTVKLKIVPPNSLHGSMAVNGAAFLALLGERFRADTTCITEAHPKVAYYALTGREPKWATHRQEMVAWLMGELGLGQAEGLDDLTDHRFDAATAALAALRGLNGDWTLDLHELPGEDYTGRIRFCGPTHYWWPANWSQHG